MDNNLIKIDLTTIKFLDDYIIEENKTTFERVLIELLEKDLFK